VIQAIRLGLAVIEASAGAVSAPAYTCNLEDEDVFSVLD